MCKIEKYFEKIYFITFITARQEWQFLRGHAAAPQWRVLQQFLMRKTFEGVQDLICKPGNSSYLIKALYLFSLCKLTLMDSSFICILCSVSSRAQGTLRALTFRAGLTLSVGFSSNDISKSYFKVAVDHKMAEIEVEVTNPCKGQGLMYEIFLQVQLMCTWSWVAPNCK